MGYGLFVVLFVLFRSVCNSSYTFCAFEVYCVPNLCVFVLGCSDNVAVFQVCVERSLDVVFFSGVC